MNDGKKLNTRASGIIAIAVMCSRVLGLVREVLFNSSEQRPWGFFSSRSVFPIFFAISLPRGPLHRIRNSFSQKIEKDGPSAAWDLASKMLTLATVFMSAISLLGIVFAGPLVRLLAPGFDPADAGFTILLTQIMYPFILLVSLAALVMGALNSRQIFTAPAMASSFSISARSRAA